MRAYEYIIPAAVIYVYRLPKLGASFLYRIATGDGVGQGPTTEAAAAGLVPG